MSFPEQVRRDVGAALGAAQFGDRAEGVKSWKGETPGVMEIVEPFGGNAYRAVYAAFFAEAVYVLHAFQKKSPDGGSQTDQRDVDAIRVALRSARADHAWRYGRGRRMAGEPRDELPSVEAGSSDVFADLGLPDASEADGKVRLAVMVNREIRRLGLRQVDAAARLRSNQAEVSRLANYKLSGISERRLMGFLNRLNLDVEITVRRALGRCAATTVREPAEG